MRKLIDFIKNNSEVIFAKNAFIFDNEQNFGIDNIYMGNIETMYKLTN